MPSKPEKRHHKEIQDSIIFVLETCSSVFGQSHLCDVPGIHHCQVISMIFALHLQKYRLGETPRGHGQKNLIYVWSYLYTFQPLNSLSCDKLYVPEILVSYTVIVLNLMCKAVIYHLSLRCVITLCVKFSHTVSENALVLLLCSSSTRISTDTLDKGLIILVTTQEISRFMYIQI